MSTFQLLYVDKDDDWTAEHRPTLAPIETEKTEKKQVRLALGNGHCGSVVRDKAVILKRVGRVAVSFRMVVARFFLCFFLLRVQESSQGGRLFLVVVAKLFLGFPKLSGKKDFSLAFFFVALAPAGFLIKKEAKVL